MEQTSTSQSVCDERAEASAALVADPCRPGARYHAEPAAELFTSPSTAKSHVLRILGTLREESPQEAAVYEARCALG